ncbi:MAG: hypothetical protein WCF90_04320 [Methanomicrobiales archaeon]
MPLYYYVETKKPVDTIAQKYITDFFVAIISGVFAVATLVLPQTINNSSYKDILQSSFF